MIKHIVLADMDSVKPGDSFYRDVNGTWDKTTEIPPTMSGLASVESAGPRLAIEFDRIKFLIRNAG